MEKIIKSISSEIKNINDDERSVVSVISSADVDREQDLILPEKINDTNYSKSPVVLFQHFPSMVVGKSLWRKVDGKNYLSKTQFATTTLANDLFTLYKDGFMTSFSIGFYPKEQPTFDEQTNLRVFGEIELLEYSLVSIPCNPNAVTLDFVKSLSSTELSNEFMKQYVIDNLELEMKKNKDEIIELRDSIGKQALFINEFNTKFEDYTKSINDIVSDISIIKNKNKADLLKKDVETQIRKAFQNLNIK